MNLRFIPAPPKPATAPTTIAMATSTREIPAVVFPAIRERRVSVPREQRPAVRAQSFATPCNRPASRPAMAWITTAMVLSITEIRAVAPAAPPGVPVFARQAQRPVRVAKFSAVRPQNFEAAIEQVFDNVMVMRVQGHPDALFMVVHSEVF